MSAIESLSWQVPYPPSLDFGQQLTREQLFNSMQSTMARHHGGPVWLFAYGSLIWRPECHSVERQRARVHGYHRGLYLFGLDRGGSCSGFAYRLEESNLDDSLMALWQREMPYPAYRPHWLTCRLNDGSKVQALGFVLERHLPCYAGDLPDGLLSQILASAKGRYGSTRDYVEQTLNALRSHQMPDRNLEARFRRCHNLREV